MRRAMFLFALLAGLIYSSACGQYSYVVVTVDPGSTDYPTRQTINAVTVNLSGAVVGTFNIPEEKSPKNLSGKFEYSTTADSGEVTVKVEGINLAGATVVTGTATTNLIAGGSAVASVVMSCVNAGCALPP